MIDSNVRKIGVKKKEPDLILVNVLENLLERARNGELTGLAFFADSAGDKAFSTFHHGFPDNVTLLGSISILHARVMSKFSKGWHE